MLRIGDDLLTRDSMSSKAASASASNRPSLLKLTIPAGGATPSPPIGPALGQKGVKAMDFCRQFNDLSKTYLPGTPLRTEVTVNPDRTFSLIVRPPSTSWLVKRAAGVEKGNSGGTVAKINGKILYEIALLKHQDPKLKNWSLRLLFRTILSQTRMMGIKVFL